MEGDRSRGEVAGQKTRIISTEAAPNSNPRHLDRSDGYFLVRRAAERPLYFVLPYHRATGSMQSSGARLHLALLPQATLLVALIFSFPVTFFQLLRYFFSSVRTSFPVLHKEWCNFFFLN
jgi:hypothetical protein